MQYYIERLSLRAWVLVILPQILRRRSSERQPPACLFMDATRPGMLVARVSAFCIPGLSVERFNFRINDVRDEQGLPLKLRIHYRDLQEIQTEVKQDQAFRRFAELVRGDNRLSASLLKALTLASFRDRQTLWRALFVIQVFIWRKRTSGVEGDAFLFLESRPWFAAIQRYSSREGLRVEAVPRTIDWPDLPLYLLRPRGMWMLRALRNRLSHSGQQAGSPQEAGIRLATDYWGYFNLNRPECYSDFFFMQASAFPASSLLVTFSVPGDPIDVDRAAELSQRGIRAVALNPLATTTTSVPVFRFWPSLANVESVPSLGDAEDYRWIRDQVEDYGLRREYWAELFRRENVRLYTSWFRYDASHCAIADAIRSVNGIMTIYQRACQLDSSPEVAVHTDVAFGYAPMDAAIERRSGSTIRYHVSVGYIGDHRFACLRQQALRARAQLQENGARYVVAFFDENSLEDERWHSGHRFHQVNYDFLLRKLMSDPSLGLVLKPKVPATLRRRLGPVSDLLRTGLSTGRCLLYEEGRVQGFHPPAVAAMASDVAIHSHLSAATAGFEAALAGTPTLLLDREAWRVSDLYELGEGRVVFSSWEELWEALTENRNGGNRPGFGDWSSMLGRMDPFRDGRGAERLGTYLLWLLEGLKQGGDRDSVMAEAAERYCREWGRDKVTEVRQETPH